jgi:hypothetical protein
MIYVCSTYGLSTEVGKLFFFFSSKLSWRSYGTYSFCYNFAENLSPVTIDAACHLLISEAEQQDTHITDALGQHYSISRMEKSNIRSQMY